MLVFWFKKKIQGEHIYRSFMQIMSLFNLRITETNKMYSLLAGRYLKHFKQSYTFKRAKLLKYAPLWAFFSFFLSRN